MPFCTYCGASFARDEHLERHILTHTGVRPYKCEYCHMSFARKDLLHRHQQMVHERNKGSDTGALPMTSKPAGRTPIACSNCAKNKTKCDKKFPCSRCASRSLRCEVRPAQRPSKKVSRPDVPHNGTEEGDGGSDGTQDDHTSQSDLISSGTSTPAHPPMSRNPSYISSVSVQSAASCHSADHQRQSSMTGLLEPAHDPGTGMPLHSPPPTFEGFMKPDGSAPDDCISDPEPSFNFDWSSLQKPLSLSYDQMCQNDMMLDPAISCSPTNLQDMSSSTGILPIFAPSFAPGPQPLSSPLSTQGFEVGSFQSFHQSEESSDASSLKPRAHSQSSMASNFTSDLDAIVMGQDAWSAFKCTSGLPSSKCPRTARINLEKLEETLKNHDTWDDWRPSWDEADYALGDNLEAVPFREGPRDKLLAITQSFLHKALEIHSDDQGILRGSESPRSRSNFIILPPARVLDCCLKSYGNSFERFYPLSPKRSLDPNLIMYGANDKASSLLLLLMIAQGALISPAVDGRWLVGGLTEACRISLFDLIEKNIMMSGDPIVQHSALLFTTQAGWSGDKWQMDIAMGQRGMYFSMLRHTGYLEGSQSPTSPFRHDLEGLWEEWQWHETRSRLTYSWMMVDQELSLFYDAPPLLLVTECGAPMPDADALWSAKTVQDWSGLHDQIHKFSGGVASGASTNVRPLCLRDLFKLFLDDTIGANNVVLTALQLRLLLHPLQSLVCQFRHLLNFFSDSKPISTATQNRLEEVESLLQRWYGLASQYLMKNPMCPTMHASLVIFHLVSLNTVSSIPDIERLARCEGVDGSFQSILWAHRSCISDAEKAVFHAGQATRLVKSMPRSIRPPWWAGALYRVALVFWCNGLVHSGMMAQSSTFSPNCNGQFPVDQLKPDHPLLYKYLTDHEGTPMLTKRDNTPLALDNPAAVLFHFNDVISEGVSTRFTEGICSKLMRLARS